MIIEKRGRLSKNLLIIFIISLILSISIIFIASQKDIGFDSLKRSITGAFIENAGQSEQPADVNALQEMLEESNPEESRGSSESSELPLAQVEILEEEIPEENNSEDPSESNDSSEEINLEENFETNETAEDTNTTNLNLTEEQPEEKTEELTEFNGSSELPPEEPPQEEIESNETNKTIEIPEINETTELVETNETNVTIETNETNITIPDNSPPTYSDFGANNTSPKKDEAVEFFAFWKDDFGLDNWVFSWNSSGTWENETFSFVSCYDKNTQILTKQGWKYFEKLTYDDEVATLNNKKVEWKKPIRIFSLQYDDEIYTIDGNIDLSVTSDQEVYARVNNKLGFLIKKTRDLLFGIDFEDFKLISITDAYDLIQDGYSLALLGEDLKPAYVTKITKEHYKGAIYDLTVPNHIVLVKGDGKAVWSSNLNVKDGWSNVTKIVNQTGTAYRFYASDLAGNWNSTEPGFVYLKENENETILLNSSSYLTVFTDKENYTQNETINIFGEILINGTRVDAEINLEIEFEDNLIYSTSIDSINGSYSYLLNADFEKEGQYLVKVSAENLSAETSFYLTNSSFLELANLSCKEFEEEVLWTSGFTQKNPNSANYYSWKPKNLCPKDDTDCFLTDVIINARIISLSINEEGEKEESYVQISSLDKKGCDDPKKGSYNLYLSKENVQDDEIKKGWYRGDEKEYSAEPTKMKPKDNLGKEFKESSGCYGIKVYSSHFSITDIFKIRYKLCWNNTNE